MQYLLLIYTNEADDSARSPEESAGIFQAYGAFTKGIIDSGNYVGGDALHPTSTATSVRVQNGATLATDGPFAETREALGGYYMVEAADLDEAIAIAARIPAASHGTVEVRPVMKIEGGAA
jgi:hypothetical protein